MENKIFNDTDSVIQEITIKPTGWSEIVIQYYIDKYGSSNLFEMVWRVKETEHVFRIQLGVFYEDSQGNYEEHFEKVLGFFRKDYLDWQKENFKLDWMQKYQRQFSGFIFTF